jgi:hypothetical protein
MPKTLVIILNHNLPEYTNRLYDSLKGFEDEVYDTMVMDNGSKPDLLPAVTHVRLEKNLYAGGAWNEAFKLVLKDHKYDSLLLLNNDIELNGEVFVRLLRHELFKNDFAIVSPSVAGRAKAWKQMQNWGSKEPRVVRWTDFEAPLFHRKIIEVIGQFSSDLYYGWGQELVCSDICEERGWKIGICDHICILHFGNQTLLQNRLYFPQSDNAKENDKPVSLKETQERAMQEYRNYFAMHPLKYSSLDELRAYGLQYSFVVSQTQDTRVSGTKPTFSFLKLFNFFRKKLV